MYKIWFSAPINGIEENSLSLSISLSEFFPVCFSQGRLGALKFDLRFI